MTQSLRQNRHYLLCHRYTARRDAVLNASCLCGGPVYRSAPQRRSGFQKRLPEGPIRRVPEYRLTEALTLLVGRREEMIVCMNNLSARINHLRADISHDVRNA